MADRNFYPAFTYGFARVYMDFFYLSNGGSALNINSIEGLPRGVVSSLTRSSTGTHVFVLSNNDRYHKVIFAEANVAILSPSIWATVTSIVNEGSATLGIGFTVRTFTTYGTTDAAASTRIYVNMVFRNSKSELS